ncbi:MAG TPA: aminoglycoside phosphotransferase family protein [Nocardioides sp.]|jgi:aminoglycoside phosphotransferase (APT) family kinase protein|uniref:aminoglycoside phosphotransferase family protein n=1 Tax=Nocardioides sp. TaxID=35761 RepID=UPI002E3482B2|nr:aminoglycoside phosphotransferase family protein [Nocardioides sp.]HEX3930756.1 aminoglycoside phosphotransferase family protein [Nocardioides sp.]
MSLESGEPSEEVPDLGPVPQRLAVDVETVRRLVADQFPQWAHLSLTPTRTPGWDNVTFRLADEMLVRLPSAAEYALAVEKEQRWLPELARHLPTLIPAPLARGLPGAGYPFHWSIFGWLPGEPAARSALADPIGIAEDVGDFVEALRRVDATGGPQPGVHNWFRGGTLRTYDATARGALAELEEHIDVDLAAAAWDDALEARWNGVDVWFHGDLAPGNLLVERGRLAAVIDFGTCGVGDPSCDLAVAWTLLDLPGRQLLRERLAVDASTWARGRGWALWKTLRNLANAVEDRDERSEAEARLIVEAILEDHGTST